MKKLYTLMLMLGMFLIPQITLNAALTPPAEYDYSFAYNAVDGEFQFSDGVDTYTPEFTRTEDGIYYNYQYIGDGEGLLPFEVTLLFNRSNTSWTFGNVGYIATDTKIGSDNTVLNVIYKTFIELNNTSNNDYYFRKDISSSLNAYYIVNINNIRISDGALNQFFIASSSFTSLLIPSKNILTFGSSSNTGIRYLDAFYLKDLGESPAYTAGVESTTAFQEGYEEGYGFGYQAGVEEDNAYSLGYAKGLSEGQDMETGSSIIVLVLGLMAFVMMLFGFTSRRRIFNLFASGLFIVLGGILVEYAAFVIVAVGLVIVNVYYTFVSD